MRSTTCRHGPRAASWWIRARRASSLRSRSRSIARDGRFRRVKIYTKTGDTGDTGLLGGGRVPKDHARVAAYGDVDETNAAIGAARAIEPQDFETPLLESIQRDLFSIGGQLAAPDPAKVAKALAKAAIDRARVAALERAIDAAAAGLPPLESFVLPAGSPKAAALHFARTVCRRAERSVVALG